MIGIERLLELAALELEPARRVALESDLERILEWVEQIREYGDASVGYLLDPGTLQLRADVPEPTLAVDEVASLAPGFESGMFVVPRVIDES